MARDSVTGVVVLKYDPTFSKPCTCFLLEDGFTLRCRISEAGSAEVVVDLALRRRKPRAGAIHIRPIDSELATWSIESAVVHQDLARMHLQINDVPAWVSRALLEL